jgi:hypothetical protein
MQRPWKLMGVIGRDIDSGGYRVRKYPDQAALELIGLNGI